MNAATTSDEVLGYWLEPKPQSEAEVGERQALWFRGGPEIDRAIAERFGGLIERARRGELDAWTGTFRGTLALVVLLDQFPRNVLRGTAGAFASDERALELVKDGFARGTFETADAFDLLFLSLPFTHAEALDAQQQSVAIVERAFLGSPPAWRPFLREAVDFARKHLDVIARFGRFPHRNATLGRETTPAEARYLEYLRASGQWL